MKNISNTHTPDSSWWRKDAFLTLTSREWEGLIRSYIFIVIPHVELQINLNKKNKCFDNILHNFIFTYCLRRRTTTCFRHTHTVHISVDIDSRTHILSGRLSYIKTHELVVILFFLSIRSFLESSRSMAHNVLHSYKSLSPSPAQCRC